MITWTNQKAGNVRSLLDISAVQVLDACRWASLFGVWSLTFIWWDVTGARIMFDRAVCGAGWKAPKTATNSSPVLAQYRLITGDIGPALCHRHDPHPVHKETTGEDRIRAWSGSPDRPALECDTSVLVELSGANLPSQIVGPSYDPSSCCRACLIIFGNAVIGLIIARSGDRGPPGSVVQNGGKCVTWSRRHAPYTSTGVVCSNTDSLTCVKLPFLAKMNENKAISRL